MKIKEIQAKTCMTKSKLTDYVINPYTGCSHGCKYCYADFIKRFQNIPDKWGEFVFAKVNCPELLLKEIEKNKPGHIWLSSVCDCYMPEEGKFKLTRKILEIFVNFKNKDKFTFEVLTKSALVKRDFDLLKKLNVDLGMSINQLDEKVSRIIEPLASPPKERIGTLKLAKKQGIRTFGFISPVLPGISKLEEVFRELSKVKVSYVWVELFNMRKSAVDKILPIYKDKFPNALEEFEWARKNQDEWYGALKKQIDDLSKKYNLRVKEIVRHDKDR
jgi:DNA repair photolyase|tara:strand:- start:349 stop:1170 length:822 start_codon:yes stop_codon:yes gene_type:complete